MNGSQLSGLDSVGIEIYAIHGYFHGLMVGQRTPEFLGFHNNSKSLKIKYQKQRKPGETIHCFLAIH